MFFILSHGNNLMAKSLQPPRQIMIHRNLPQKECAFLQLFEGFDTLPIVKKIFGGKTDHMLSNLKICFSSKYNFMWIDDKTGRVMLNRGYVETGKTIYLYLDAVHELVHIRQHHEGKELFDPKYEYVDRPTEIEAYEVCVGEARKLGMKPAEIRDYLYMNWLTDAQFERLCKTLGL
jgi:hypothetical protein